MKRLVGLIVLLGLAAAGLYYWRARPEAPIRIDELRLPEPVAAVKDRLGDTALRLAVRTAFALHRRLQPLDLQVEAEGGVVTLRGVAPDADTRAIAERVAAEVPEVTRVRNRIAIAGNRAAATPTGRR